MENSPFLEKLRKRGYEVLFMVDPIDEYVVQQLKVSVAHGDAVPLTSLVIGVLPYGRSLVQQLKLRGGGRGRECGLGVWWYPLSCLLPWPPCTSLHLILASPPLFLSFIHRSTTARSWCP